MPEARISPKVIFIGRARAGMPHDSADRASWEAATAWAVAARALQTDATKHRFKLGGVARTALAN
jgi:hypothetical protein